MNLLTGASLLALAKSIYYEASGQLQTPFMGKTMVKEWEMATYLHKTTLFVNIGKCWTNSEMYLETLYSVNYTLIRHYVYILNWRRLHVVPLNIAIRIGDL